jgi:micrococcal nuclease
MYEYKAKVVKVIDGDTYDMMVDLGFKVTMGMRVRLADVCTPELNAQDESERKKALEAKEFVAQYEGHEVTIRTRKTTAGKELQTFGRYVADISVPWEVQPGKERFVDLGELLVERELAELWEGGA